MAMLKEAVCWSTVWQLRQEARHPGQLDLWFKDRRRQKVLRQAAGAGGRRPAGLRRCRDGRDRCHGDPATEAFVAHRNLLFTVAYEILGSAADAEDVLQETWLRWVKVDLDQVATSART